MDAIWRERIEVLDQEIAQIEEQLKSFEGLDERHQALQKVEWSYFSHDSPDDVVHMVCKNLGHTGEVFTSKAVRSKCLDVGNVYNILNRLRKKGIIKRVYRGQWLYIGEL